MFEKYLVHPKGFKNVHKSNETTGYELQLRIPYYRGIPMSCVEEIKLTIDDTEVSPNLMSIKVKEEWFKYSEISTAINHRWEMVDPITVFVEQSGGLNDGEHKIHAFVKLRISYQPHPNIGEDEKVLTLEA